MNNFFIGLQIGIGISLLIGVAFLCSAQPDDDEQLYCYQVAQWHKYGDGNGNLQIGWPPYKGEDMCK